MTLLARRTSEVAGMQQALFVAGVLAALGWLWWWRADPLMAWGGLAVMAVTHALVLALQFGLSVGVSRWQGQPVSWGPELVVAWWQEVVVAATVFGWQQPWQWRAWPDRLPPAPPAIPPGAAPASGPRGVLLVHGFMCNRGLWNGWQAELAQRACPVVAVNLEPFRGSIDEYVPIIDSAVAALTLATGCTPLVVAHSMGGLAMRAWLRATPGAGARVAHIITLGTPHQGTWLASFGLAVNARQMRMNSPWLRALAAQEPADMGKLFTCWHSCKDNIVFPMGVAVLPGCEARYLPHVGHVALVDHPQVRAHAMAWLPA